jgi:hypothetical protein
MVPSFTRNDQHVRCWGVPRVHNQSPAIGLRVVLGSVHRIAPSSAQRVRSRSLASKRQAVTAGRGRPSSSHNCCSSRSCLEVRQVPHNGQPTVAVFGGDAQAAGAETTDQNRRMSGVPYVGT